jgi:hypothetical protein
MGTSVNQASPDTLNWRAAQATYQSAAFPIERVLQEIWRAATNQPKGNLASQLAEPIISRMRDLALQGRTPLEVAAAINREVAQSRQASLAVEIARRAALQCVGAQDRAQAYSERIFAEASNYLLSRDLPSYVGPNARNQTVADSAQFKQSVIGAAAQTVREVEMPRSRTAAAWRKYTAAVIDRLKRQT